MKPFCARTHPFLSCLRVPATGVGTYVINRFNIYLLVFVNIIMAERVAFCSASHAQYPSSSCVSHRKRTNYPNTAFIYVPHRLKISFFTFVYTENDRDRNHCPAKIGRSNKKTNETCNISLYLSRFVPFSAFNFHHISFFLPFHHCFTRISVLFHSSFPPPTNKYVNELLTRLMISRLFSVTVTMKDSKNKRRKMGNFSSFLLSESGFGSVFTRTKLFRR